MSVEVSSAGADGAAPAPANGRAALVVLLAFAVFSGTDAIVKVLAAGIAAPQVTFLVTAAALLILFCHAGVVGRLRRLVPRQPGLALLRALLLAGDTLLIHYAFAALPLAEAYLLAFLTPILVAMLGFVLLGERLSPIGWAGVVIGFAGVAVALKPGVAPLNLGHAAALGSAVLFALSLVLLRRAKAAETDEALVASLLVVLTPLSLGVALVGGIVPVSAQDFALAFAGGALLLGGHALLVRAFRIGEASVVAPFQYSQIVWGGLYGVFLFSTPLEFHTLAGAGIIVLSGWFVLK
ncbi:S-adenosylmethionine uptake transporter [Sinorhizobium terangae]|uniref:EamA family transporter n=1 Tax=Sinorhizobium terangae TaxID=110322 RepID=A0A6N7LDW9_SINTE|nr:DMT family transporter [Sinorhizobium terangae]MBB4186431.1 S-adenosylmethionine uptake transporter [Sinorhizobium terangae]MQX16037.1 EamA family transporter [Sinorhizobium terangae]